MTNNTDEVYVVTAMLSGYKKEPDASSIASYICSDYDKAQEMMGQVVLEIYAESAVIQESETKYFSVQGDITYFGEDEDEWTGYRVEWGQN